MDENDKSAKDLFEEAPSWYDAPTLTEEETNPDYVPAKRERLGESAGMGSLANGRKKGMDAGRQATLIWVFIIFFLGGGALLVLVLGTVQNGVEQGPQDFVVGACADDFPTDSPALRAARLIECDGFGEITAVVQAEPEQMPAIGEGFWVDFEAQCEDWAIMPGRYVALAVAETEQEWADGNRTIICIDAS